MSKALYRKYRSKSLSEVVGQNHITDILSRALKEGKISHAYLFTGPRGVGKTSIARILAHEINKLPYDENGDHLDIIEIDAASNNGVDDIRELRERVRLAPVSAAKKVYIIDEVHMLSKAAFNALLKTLEEPPEHVVFILATTDADKLPDTIISRTQRFTFRTIAAQEVASHLAAIAKQEGFSADDDALALIAVHGGGSFRDSISMLDQLHSAAPKDAGITKDVVTSFLGLPPTEVVDTLLTAHEEGDLHAIVSLLDSLEASGTQPVAVATELIRAIRVAIGDKPQFLPLLDSLLNVAGSSRPDIKLLTSLAGFQTKQPVKGPVTPKTVPLVSSAPAISSVPIAPKKTPALIVAAPKEENTPPAEPVSASVAQQEFDWPKVLEHIQKNYIAVYSVLSKCTPSLMDSKLVIYTSNGFYKKKLDTIRYRTHIIDTLASLGMEGLVLETIGTPPPPKDTVAATVAAIMGGGEEFAIEEESKG